MYELIAASQDLAFSKLNDHLHMKSSTWKFCFLPSGLHQLEDD